MITKFEEKLNNELPKFVKAELVHIECGTFNGIAIYRVDNKILKFELGTPHYNDYGEYRVNTEFEVFEKDDGRAAIPGKDIQLTLEQYNWWMNEKTELTEFMQEAQVCGGKNKNDFVVIDKDNEMIKFSEWETREHDAYEHFMFHVLKNFYFWYREESPKGNITGGLMIYQ